MMNLLQRKTRQLTDWIRLASTLFVSNDVTRENFLRDRKERQASNFAGYTFTGYVYTRQSISLPVGGAVDAGGTDGAALVTQVETLLSPPAEPPVG